MTCLAPLTAGTVVLHPFGNVLESTALCRAITRREICVAPVTALVLILGRIRFAWRMIRIGYMVAPTVATVNIVAEADISPLLIFRAI